MVNRATGHRSGGLGERRRCSRCGGNLIVCRDRRSGRWWREASCLQCGRAAEDRPIADLASEEQRQQDKVLGMPSDMRGWKNLLERPSR